MESQTVDDEAPAV
ncbi:uncharacterized LOC128462377 isoform 2 [Homo sapiens]|uniref:Uncharacterized protein n=1 Tax=Homo sapiens TaxID=9606 RepID=A0A804HJT0_HUMAN|nr:uncharacterized LOC128462377 isoform 2 [Homo sapiens]